MVWEFLADVVLGGLLELLVSFGQPAEKTPLIKFLEVAHWKRRVVLVLAPSPQQPGFREQRQLLDAASANLREYDTLVLYRLHGELVASEKTYLRQHYGLQLKVFEVVLIGKDGGAKLRSTHPLNPTALFATIDQMPMRQQEMRRQQ